MITQETKPVKTWGGFNLAILKVNLNPLSWKNWSSYNKTYKPPRSTSYCYPPVELTDTTTCKLRIHGLFLSWILHQIQAHPLVFSLSFNGSNWNDHQGVEKSSPWKPQVYVKETSSKISQEIHINRNMSNTKTWLGFPLYTYGKLEI